MTGCKGLDLLTGMGAGKASGAAFALYPPVRFITGIGLRIL